MSRTRSVAQTGRFASFLATWPVVQYWPVFLLGSGRAGLASVLAGSFFGCYALLYRLRRSDLGIDSGELLALALVAWLVSSGVPFDLEGLKALTTLGLVALPSFLYFGSGGPLSKSPAVIAAAPLLAWAVVTGASDYQNPIMLGHIGWVVAVLAFTSPNQCRVVRSIGVLGIATTVISPSTGPLVAGVAALSVGVFGKRTGTKASRAAILAMSACLGLLAWSELNSELATSFTDGNNTTATRLRIWTAILDEASLTGHGFRPIPVPHYDSIRTGHNFVLDALDKGGLFAVALVVALLLRSLWLGRRLSPSCQMVQVGLLTAGLFSGGVQTEVVWLAVGLGIGAPRIASGSPVVERGRSARLRVSREESRRPVDSEIGPSKQDTHR